MNVITNLFSSLKIKKRILLGYADTEGAPHRAKSSSSLWNMAVIFKYIVDDDFNVLEECFHVTHFAMPKRIEKSQVTQPLKTHMSTIEHLKDTHNCDTVCLCFWNAPHDNAVLRYYESLSIFDTVDLLKCARDCSNNKYESYSIGALCRQFNVRSDEAIHTGLGDTIRMIKILPRVGITEPKKMSPYIIKNVTTVAKPNHVQETIGEQRSISTIKKDEVHHHHQQAKDGVRTREKHTTSSRSGRITDAIRRAKSHNESKRQGKSSGK